MTNDRENKLYAAEKEVVKDTLERLWEHVVAEGSVSKEALDLFVARQQWGEAGDRDKILG